MRSQGLSSGALVALFFGGVLGLLMAPAWCSPTPWLIGDPRSDLWKHVWGHAWVRDELWGGGGWPLVTTSLDFPRGGRLLVIDPLSAALDALVGQILDPVSSFNVVVWLQWTLAAWAAWFLAWRITRDPGPALVAGAIYGGSPWLIAYGIGSGVTETLGAGWLPLVWLTTLRALEGGWREALLAGLALSLASWSSWYFLVFGLVSWAAWIQIALVSGGRAPWLPVPTPGWPWRALVALGGVGLAVGPLAWAFAWTLEAPESLLPELPQRLAFIERLEFDHHYFPVVDYFLPGKARLHASGVIDRLTQTPYLGWLALGLSLAGWMDRGGRGAARGWCLAAALLFLVSLGPAVSWTAGWRSAPVNLAFGAVSSLLATGMLTSPFRVHLLTTLCLAVAASLGLGALLARAALPPRARVLAGALAASLVLAEVFLLSPVEFPLPFTEAIPPSILHGLDLEGRAGVIDLPPFRPGTELSPGEAFFAQRFHRGGIPYTPAGLFRLEIAENGFYRGMWSLAGGASWETLDPLKLGAGLEALARDGYSLIVVHGGAMSPELFRVTVAGLRGWLGEPERHLDGRVLFRLRPVHLRGPDPGTTGSVRFRGGAAP